MAAFLILLNGLDDPTVQSLENYFAGKTFGDLPIRCCSAKLEYSTTESVAPDLTIDLLKRFTNFN